MWSIPVYAHTHALIYLKSVANFFYSLCGKRVQLQRVLADALEIQLSHFMQHIAFQSSLYGSLTVSLRACVRVCVVFFLISSSIDAIAFAAIAAMVMGGWWYGRWLGFEFILAQCKQCHRPNVPIYMSTSQIALFDIWLMISLNWRNAG